MLKFYPSGLFCYCRWTKISSNIASGEILFSDLEHHVGTTYREDYEAMKNELLAMGINEKIVDRRLKQLQQYRQLETSVRGAKVILKFARLYNLSGNFKQIEDIATVKNFIICWASRQTLES